MRDDDSKEKNYKWYNYKSKKIAGYNLPDKVKSYNKMIEKCYNYGLGMGADIAAQGSKFVFLENKDQIRTFLDRIHVIKE